MPLAEHDNVVKTFPPIEPIALSQYPFRGDEDGRVGKFLRAAEATHQNTRHQSDLVLRRARKTGYMPVSVGPGATAFTRMPDLATSSATDLVMPSTACLRPT
jgi:hypothetical protein